MIARKSCDFEINFKITRFCMINFKSFGRQFIEDQKFTSGLSKEQTGSSLRDLMTSLSLKIRFCFINILDTIICSNYKYVSINISGEKHKDRKIASSKCLTIIILMLHNTLRNNFYLCSLCYMCICMHQVCLSMKHSFHMDC